MVKLVYQTSLGPISLEYEQAMITVGSAPDNELVLPHPSVLPYHCRLALQDDRVVVHPGEGEGGGLEEVPVDGRFTIGELTFEVHHSGNTVAIPLGALGQPGLPADDPDAPYYCQNCQIHFHEHEVKRIGIQGRGKHALCPRCSRPVSLSHPVETPPEGFVQKIRKGLMRFIRGR